jgi:O-acetylhomoserine (thiol)-lyase
MKKKFNGFATNAIHFGHEPDSETGSRAVPLYQTTSYSFKDTAHAADLFGLRQPGNIYTRIMNPTTDVLEQRMAALEGGAGALATASGQAAETLTILTLARTGEEIVASTDLYGGTVSLFQHTLPKLGIGVKFVSPNNLEAWQQAINGKTRAFYAESIGNPKLDIVDLERIAAIGTEHGIPLIVDNTVTTPFLLRPFDFGAAIVVHSATKFIGGHGTSIGGLIVDSGRFDWAASGRFPHFCEPDPAYHGLKFNETFAPATFITRARVLGLRDLGAAMSPFNAWLFLQGLETLQLRMAQHSKNAFEVANYLHKHNCVRWVRYPGLTSSPTHGLVNKYLPKGQGALVPKNSRQPALPLISSVSVWALKI